MYERLPAPPPSDTIDVADVIRTLRRQWRAVIGFLVIGVLGAGAVVLFAPRRFDGKATLLARPGHQSTSSIAGRITGLGELLGGLGGIGTAGSLETELQVLRSRELTGRLVDSLQLQLRVRDPAGVAPLALIASSDLPGSFEPRTYKFERAANGTYRADRDGKQYELTPGRPGPLDIGSLTLRAADLPQRFKIKVMDREDAITRVGKNVTVTKAGGDVAKIVYRGDDSVTAAAAVNALVKFYLERGKTTDRGINQRRVEYVSAQLDSTGAELSRTERELRQYQESSRILDAEVMGQVELEASAELRKTLTELQVDEAGIKQLLAQADRGRLTSRELAAYPTFLRGSSANPLATQLSELEAQRIRLLERRTERDPEVRALDETMRLVEANIVGVARSYATAVTRQREEMQTRVDSIQRTLLALPAAAQRGGRLQRDVRRLTQIYAALEAQLIEARLAAIGEGGEVRQIDVAVPQRKPAFPQPWLTMGIGTAGGLLTGMIAALILSWFGRWLRDPIEIERAMGITALRFEPGAPLLVAGTGSARSVLVVPVGDGARAGAAIVAERLVHTARQRTLQATIVDLSSSHTTGNGKVAIESEQVGALIERLEQQNGMVVVQLPGLTSDVTFAAMRETRPVILVTPPGPVDRVRLAQAVETLRRLQVPCAGVVITDEPTPRALL